MSSDPIDDVPASRSCSTEASILEGCFEKAGVTDSRAPCWLLTETARKVRQSLDADPHEQLPDGGSLIAASHDTLQLASVDLFEVAFPGQRGRTAGCCNLETCFAQFNEVAAFSLFGS